MRQWYPRTTARIHDVGPAGCAPGPQRQGNVGIHVGRAPWSSRLFCRRRAASDGCRGHRAGGCRDVTLEIKGDAVYSKLKFEAGVHRVQRVPATETQGRIHTSTATVAIMPEVDEVTVNIEKKDIEMHTARSGEMR